jgi:hypothetical protein
MRRPGRSTARSSAGVDGGPPKRGRLETFVIVLVAIIWAINVLADIFSAYEPKPWIHGVFLMALQAGLGWRITRLFNGR